MSTLRISDGMIFSLLTKGSTHNFVFKRGKYQFMVFPLIQIKKEKTRSYSKPRDFIRRPNFEAELLNCAKQKGDYYVLKFQV